MPGKEQIAHPYRPVPPRAHTATRERPMSTPDTEEYEMPRMPVMVKKYHHPQQRVQLVVEDRRKKRLQPEIVHQQTGYHPLVYFLLGMLVLALFFLLANIFLAHLAGLAC